MYRELLKSSAKEQIKGKIWNILLVVFVGDAISSVASWILGLVPNVGAIAALAVTAPLMISFYKIFLDIVNEDKTPKVADLFYGYYDFANSASLVLLVFIFTMLWSLLFIIPGIIKAISYSQAYYILAENKGMSALEAINRSKAMMEGHKMDYFILGLSFIGWSVVGMVTFGIAFIWIMPYMQATYTNFYNEIKNVA